MSREDNWKNRLMIGGEEKCSPRPSAAFLAIKIMFTNVYATEKQKLIEYRKLIDFV